MRVTPACITIALVAGAALLTAPRDARVLDPGSWLNNGRFDTDVSSWALEAGFAGTSFTWASQDRDASPSSGSARLDIDKATVTNANVIQCRPVPPRATTAALRGSIRYLVDSGDSSAYIQAGFWTGPGCTGQFIDGLAGSVNDPSLWTDIMDVGQVPDGAMSVGVRLGLLKATTAAPLWAEFDNVSLAFNSMPAHMVLVPGIARD